MYTNTSSEQENTNEPDTEDQLELLEIYLTNFFGKIAQLFPSNLSEDEELLKLDDTIAKNSHDLIKLIDQIENMFIDTEKLKNPDNNSNCSSTKQDDDDDDDDGTKPSVKDFIDEIIKMTNYGEDKNEREEVITKESTHLPDKIKLSICEIICNFLIRLINFLIELASCGRQQQFFEYYKGN